jgi:excinuclease UvrABC nuclease subunit
MINNLIPLNLSPLSPLCGIYFLYDNEELVYIGHSKRIPMRICEHLSNLNGCDKEFTHAYFRPCEEDLLFATEMAFIRKHRPKYNKWHTNDMKNFRVIKPPTEYEYELITKLLEDEI